MSPGLKATILRRETGLIGPLRNYNNKRSKIMNVSTLLLIILVVLLIGGLPTWPYSLTWGYYPSGGVGLVVLVLLVLILIRRI